MLAVLFLTGALALLGGYILYARKLDRIFDVSGERPTPAETEYDGIDYVPARAPVLFGHHFSSIAGAGPIVGPIIAALAFGWLPAVAWILLGTIFIGGMHDYAALMASIRNRGRSIGEVARGVISPTAQKILLAFIWLTLIYVLIVFLDLTATTFTADGGVATSSIIFILLAVLFGLSIYRLRVPLWAGSLIFVPLIFAAIHVGQKLPIEAAALPQLVEGMPGKTWVVFLVIYCYCASVTPVWILLQPRDYLSSFLLYGTVLASALGLLFGGFDVAFPAFIACTAPIGPLFPVLFVTIACGAISGFHSVIASGTTAKQLRREGDAKVIGYGGMVAEGWVALIAVASVIILSGSGDLVRRYNAHEVSAIGIFTAGMGRFVEVLGLPAELGRKFGGLAISTFLLTTLDTCTRLGRFLLHELFGIRGVRARYLSSLLTIILPALFVFMPFRDAAGNLVPAWKAIWPVFGTANQLLAALGLLVIAVWLKRQGKPTLFVILPMMLLFAVTLTSLIQIILSGTQSRPVEMIAGLLFILTIGMVAMALRAAVRGEIRAHPQRPPA